MCAITVGLLMAVSRELPAESRAPAQAGGASAIRTVWGEPDLTGVWGGVTSGATPQRDTFNLAQLERLYTPEARTEIKKLSGKDDPGLRCVPQAFPRAVLLGQPIQIVQGPGVVVVMTEAFHTFRAIPTDNRRRDPDLLFPMYLGDSVGRWEGDTLVVEVTSFNGESWLANATDRPTATSAGVWPTSASLRVIERWRRLDAGTLEYEAIVEDPEMLTGSWRTPKVQFKREARDRIDVDKCFAGDPTTLPARLRATK